MHQAGISKHREDLSQQLLCEATHEMNPALHQGAVLHCGGVGDMQQLKTHS